MADHADRDGGSLLNFLARKYHESDKEMPEGGVSYFKVKRNHPEVIGAVTKEQLIKKEMSSLLKGAVPHEDMNFPQNVARAGHRADMLNTFFSNTATKIHGTPKRGFHILAILVYQEL